MTGSSGNGGLFASVKNLAATCVAIGRTRLELLGNEIAVERQRLLSLLILSQALVFSLILGAILLIALLVLLFWDQRVLVVAMMTAFFLGLAGYLYVAIRRLLRSPKSVFADSLAQLEEDVRQLRTTGSHAKKAD